MKLRVRPGLVVEAWRRRLGAALSALAAEAVRLNQLGRIEGERTGTNRAARGARVRRALEERFAHRSTCC